MLVNKFTLYVATYEYFKLCLYRYTEVLRYVQGRLVGCLCLFCGFSSIFTLPLGCSTFSSPLTFFTYALPYNSNLSLSEHHDNTFESF
jgi:hypothetical protein